MKKSGTVLILIFCIFSSCSTQKEISYFNNLSLTTGESRFPMSPPEYKVQNRDMLYITVKAMNPDGSIQDYLAGSGTAVGSSLAQGESGGYLYGYEVKKDGTILLPVAGSVYVLNMSLDEIRALLQKEFIKSYKNAIVECKLLSFKFTVLGEVKVPGTYLNYNNYLTILEAIGKAGGIGDYGVKSKVLVLRSSDKVTKTYTISLQDEKLLSSEAYFLLPNDVVIVEPGRHKIFNLNLPTVSFIISAALSAVTTTLLLINYVKK
jgi:polysaccharide biosynthesis/export protein